MELNVALLKVNAAHGRMKDQKLIFFGVKWEGAKIRLDGVLIKVSH